MFRNICRNTDNKLYYILKYVIKMAFYILVLKKKKCDGERNYGKILIIKL